MLDVLRNFSAQTKAKFAYTRTHARAQHLEVINVRYSDTIQNILSMT